jgi:hypothetical protein
MTVREALSHVRRVQVLSGSAPAIVTTARLLAAHTGAAMRNVTVLPTHAGDGVFQVTALAPGAATDVRHDTHVEVRLGRDGSGRP